MLNPSAVLPPTLLGCLEKSLKISPPNDKKFTINGVDTKQIYVINFNRARFKERLDEAGFVPQSAFEGFSRIGDF